MKYKHSHIVLVIFCVIAFSAAVRGQNTDDDTDRSITSLDFQNQRPTASAKAGIGNVSKSATKSPKGKRSDKIAVISSSRRRYGLVKKIVVANPNIATIKKSKSLPKNEELGVTFWRMRPPRADEDDAPTFAVQTKNGNEKWTAERVASTTRFQKGDLVRFSVESSRTGFLYIINREFYTDNSKGGAKIIYPTLRTRGGDNRVVAGSLIEIPAASEPSPYFMVNPKKSNYAGEEIIIVISPIKFENINLELRAQSISSDELKKWLADWATTVDVYDADDGEGIAVTKSETETDGARELTREEPLPQTIYRVKTAGDVPLVVSFQMNARTP